MADSASQLLIDKQSLRNELGAKPTTFRKILRAAEEFFGFSTGRARMMSGHDAELVREYLRKHSLST